MFFGAIRDSAALDALKRPYTALGMVADASILRELYAQSTVVLSSSLYETLPGTLIEGQAAGCWAVSFGEGGQADIIEHGKTGYIARYRDAADLAAGIRLGLGGDFSPERQRQSVVDRFSAPAVAARYMALCRL